MFKLEANSDVIQVRKGRKLKTSIRAVCLKQDWTPESPTREKLSAKLTDCIFSKCADATASLLGGVEKVCP